MGWYQRRVHGRMNTVGIAADDLLFEKPFDEV